MPGGGPAELAAQACKEAEGAVGSLLTAVGTFAFRSRRAAGARLDVHRPTLEGDLRFFLCFFSAALLLGLGAPAPARAAVAIALVLTYGVYVRLTLRGGGGVQASISLKSLYLDTTREDPPSNGAIVLQLFVALGAMVFRSTLPVALGWHSPTGS